MTNITKPVESVLGKVLKPVKSVHDKYYYTCFNRFQAVRYLHGLVGELKPT